MTHDEIVARQRILGHLQTTLESLAEEVHPVAPGYFVLARSLPLVFTLNQLRITKPATPGQILELVEQGQRDLPYRHVVVEHEETARSLEGPLRNSGWTVEHQVLMPLSAEPDRSVDLTAVTELSEGEAAMLMRTWSIEDHLDSTEGVLDQLEEYNRREGGLWHERSLGIRDAAGKPVAVTKLRSAGTTAWVEDLYTLPEARRQGHARTLVTFAVEETRAAGHDFAFIMADDDGWPKNLYAEVGFRAVGVISTFHSAVL